ncbi:glycosyltransferase [Candidatus Pelagibacter sp.]|nr:glycosyltransferase [Candidatus Pelagibacter sp.]
MKVSILLPYKENFSHKYAGAVSLFVKDTSLYSKYKDSIFVYGNMRNAKPFLKNYVNIELSKKILQSNSKNYVAKFLEKEKENNSDIIEIHNRPNYIRYLENIKNKKIILYFHNDPLSMNGSKNVSDRLYLLNNIDKILFNSKWSQKRFFIGIDNENLLKQKTSVCYQSSSKIKINFSKKEKLISFVGKLNRAKGYDLFGEAIVKILDKYPDWKALVVGDEPREKIVFKHKNLKNIGFTSNEIVLKKLKAVSISVVCSRWEEPFGRTSLEAASRGSAVIISNKGGLPETSKSAVILKQLNSTNIFNNIEHLILNKNKLRNIQKENYKNFKFTHDYISRVIDNVRDQYQSKFFVNINKDKNLKIMHITNFNERFNGRLHYNTGRRINNGFIRLGHNVLSLSDRDILHNNKSLRDLKGHNNLQKKILDTYDNFKPDLIILGHADKVSLFTLEKMKKLDKNLKIAQWFLDPLSKYGPDHKNNSKRILDKTKLLDKTFLTTDPNSLPLKIPNAHFIPNPCDKSFEILENYKKKCDFDVFFAMSHGVHRGELKKGKSDDREIFINKLIKKNKDVKFDVYGMNNVQPVWGEQFLKKISNCYMGINLSRGKPIKYYSSDRIAQLIGNGLLTFIDEKTYLSDFFNKDEIVFYKNLDDLSYKIKKYKKDVKTRKKIARLGKKKYFKYFNSTNIAEFIINKSFDIKKKYFWENVR